MNLDGTKFNQLVKQTELNPDVAKKLYEVLSTCDIVLLCGDSSSMNIPIAEPNMPKMTTRWLELKKLVTAVIELVTSINPYGLDIYFFNHPVLRNVTNVNDLHKTFSNLPNGKTPLIKTLRKIYNEKAGMAQQNGRQLLIIVISDGEPSDGECWEFRNVLIQKPSNVHVSLVNATDNKEDTTWLDGLGKKIPNFDTTDDYHIELKKMQEQNCKFDYTAYVIKILLATFIKKYFNVDQSGTNSYSMRDVSSQPMSQYTSTNRYNRHGSDYNQHNSNHCIII
jgi:hypothetical protein